MKYSPEGLALAGLDLVPPFVVDLCLDPGADLSAQIVTELTFTHVARVLPGRRVSGLAEHNGEVVFAKLFYGKRARRYWQRELGGAARLMRAGVNTPAVIDKGATADGGGFVVFFQPLLAADGQSEAHNLRDDDLEDMLAAVQMLAQLHDANLVQTDVHVDNFLRCSGQYFAIDADGIRRAHLLRQHFANLGMLLAQRTPLRDADIAEVWAAYSASRGAYVTRMGSAEQLAAITRRQRAKRVQRYLKKTQRECTEFVHKRSFTRNILCDRGHWPALQRLMFFPQAMVGEGTPLKLGNSSTVVRVTIDGVRYIVKRYNIKNPLHRFRRWFKRRARHAWCNGHLLSFLGIDTARPIALLEQKWGWFTGVCYLVMPDCGDRDLAQVLATDEARFEQLVVPTVQLLKGLRAAGLQHGDLKATNFVLSDEQLVLIDYDAVTRGDHDKDRTRFLANWDDQPQLLNAWTQALQEAGL